MLVDKPVIAVLIPVAVELTTTLALLFRSFLLLLTACFLMVVFTVTLPMPARRPEKVNCVLFDDSRT